VSARMIYRCRYSRDWGRFSSPERRPFQSDIDCEDRHYRRAQNDGCHLLQRVNRKETCYNHSDAPNNICDQKHEGDRRCPLLHGQNEQPGDGVESTDRCAKVGGGRDLGGGEAEESVSEAGRQLRKSEDNHQKSEDDDASRAVLVRRLIHLKSIGGNSD